MELAFALVCFLYVIYMVGVIIGLALRALARAVIRFFRGRPEPAPPPPPRRTPLTQEERDRRASALRPRSTWIPRRRWPVSRRS